MTITDLKKQEFNELDDARVVDCPDKDHIVFARFYALAKEYMNSSYIKHTITERFKKRKKQIKARIKKLEDDKAFYTEKSEQKQASIIHNLEFKISKEDQERLDAIDINILNDEIEALTNEELIIDKWQKIPLGKNKHLKATSGLNKAENDLFAEIINEFFNIYTMVVNIKPLSQYKAVIEMKGSNKEKDMLACVATELMKQIGLCIEGDTHEYYYSDGNGKFIPFNEDGTILGYVKKGTTFISPKGVPKSGNFINMKDLFEKIPQWVDIVRYKNQDLIGFNNCFYNIKDERKEKLQPKIPLLPLRNIKTELYLDAEISGGAMEDIFNTCFTDQDREALLAYIGCCLYDRGYTQRQESFFFLSKGDIGKTTFIKAVCDIFHEVRYQIVNKLKDDKFGLSLFAEAECMIFDEIQGAPQSFVEYLKIISTGAGLAIEKKKKDTVNIPAELVPRCWFIGNQFPRQIYEAVAGEGVSRRILVVVPKQSIKDCGYSYQDLIQDDCKRWIVQQATKTYQKLGLNETSISIPSVSKEEKLKRIEKCTFPEAHFIKEHLEVVYEGEYVDIGERPLLMSDVQEFIYQEISDNMLEATIRTDNTQTFSVTLKDALNITQDSYYAYSRCDDGLRLNGIIPKSEKAIEYFDNLKKQREEVDA